MSPWFPTFHRNHVTIVLLAILLEICFALDPTRPNFIFFLTDDQDLIFNSMDYMPFTSQFFATNGIEFTNSFISTPICCPSRTESITGRTFHNIRSLQNPKENDCMSIAATYNVFNNTDSMFQIFHSNGYITSSFGKLTNNMNVFWCNDNPPLVNGFDRIQCPCDYNNFYGNEYMNLYLNKTIDIQSNLPLTPELHETPMVGNATLQFLQKIINNKSITKPFITWIAPHAPHFPADPTNWYSELYPNATAPRTPNYNVHTENHHYFVSTNPQLDAYAQTWIDQLWRDRLRSLLSVDDMFRDLITLLQDTKILYNTYILFSSDHGYHLGQWRIPCSKQQPYETDVRIPTYISGPGIKKGMSDYFVSNVDFLPTFLDLAEIEYGENVYDGMSWVKGGILNGYKNKAYDGIKWRNTLLITYGGGGDTASDFSHCQTWWPLQNNSFPGQDIRPIGYNNQTGQAWITDSKPMNTWRAIRIFNDSMDVVYAEFVSDIDNVTNMYNPNYYEYYDINADPYQMDNLYGSLSNRIRTQFHELLMSYATCNGTGCW